MGNTAGELANRIKLLRLQKLFFGDVLIGHIQRCDFDHQFAGDRIGHWMQNLSDKADFVVAQIVFHNGFNRPAPKELLCVDTYLFRVLIAQNSFDKITLDVHCKDLVDGHVTAFGKEFVAFQKTVLFKIKGRIPQTCKFCSAGQSFFRGFTSQLRGQNLIAHFMDRIHEPDQFVRLPHLMSIA